MFIKHNSKQFGKQFYINPSNLALSAFAQERNPAMSDAYYERWNDSLQSGIDERIERYRKADAELVLAGVTVPGTYKRDGLDRTLTVVTGKGLDCS